MAYWFVFCRGDVLLERRTDGTHTIPSGEQPPIGVTSDTHILNVSPMDDGTPVKAFAIDEVGATHATRCADCANRSTNSRCRSI